MKRNTYSFHLAGLALLLAASISGTSYADRTITARITPAAPTETPAEAPAETSDDTPSDEASARLLRGEGAAGAIDFQRHMTFEETNRLFTGFEVTCDASGPNRLCQFRGMIPVSCARSLTVDPARSVRFQAEGDEENHTYRGPIFRDRGTRGLDCMNEYRRRLGHEPRCGIDEDPIREGRVIQCKRLSRDFANRNQVLLRAGSGERLAVLRHDPSRDIDMIPDPLMSGDDPIEAPAALETRSSRTENRHSSGSETSAPSSAGHHARRETGVLSRSRDSRRTRVGQHTMTLEQLHRRNIRACNSNQEELDVALQSYDWLCENEHYSERECSAEARNYRRIVEQMIRAAMQECTRRRDMSRGEVDACRNDLLAFANDFPEAADTIATALRTLAVRLVNRRDAEMIDYEDALAIHEDMASLDNDLSQRGKAMVLESRRSIESSILRLRARSGDTIGIQHEIQNSSQEFQRMAQACMQTQSMEYCSAAANQRRRVAELQGILRQAQQARIQNQQTMWAMLYGNPNQQQLGGHRQMPQGGGNVFAFGAGQPQGGGIQFGNGPPGMGNPLLARSLGGQQWRPLVQGYNPQGQPAMMYAPLGGRPQGNPYAFAGGRPLTFRN